MKKEYEKLVEEHGLNLTKLCLSLCNNSIDAQDLYQSTWEKVFRKYKLYKKEQPFEKWLFSVCINTHRDMLKRFDVRRAFRFNSSDEQELFLSSIPFYEEEKDDYISLHNALNILRREQREVIVLYYFKDYSISELSEILSIPEGTVKSRLHKARELLKKELNFDE
ncbi:MAG: RNA polymerase sigma factor [Ruminococcus sp.]|nr:RNA polymerase sigma factor [Ruminococcus sp.]